MTREDLEKLLTKIKKMLPTLEKAYRLLSDEEIENRIGSIHLPCDSCEEKDRKYLEQTMNIWKGDKR